MDEENLALISHAKRNRAEIAKARGRRARMQSEREEMVEVEMGGIARENELMGERCRG